MSDPVQNLRMADLQVSVLADENDRLRAEVASLKEELETERLRLAACGTAALGYFDGCRDEYRSASLDDVLRLYEQSITLTQQLAAANGRVEKYRVVMDDAANAISDGYTVRAEEWLRAAISDLPEADKEKTK